MDFCQLLHTAQKNDKNSAGGVRYYSTKFEPPKKIKKESKDLSANIKKFLAKKEAEEQRKREEDNKKKEDLLALRAQDKKATRRVNVMLKRTKSANQSVIEDAKDNTHTAVTRAGPDQPDEDDYGYVSQEASSYYEKMMEMYSAMPEEPKFKKFEKKVSTNLNSTKDRVKAALEKEREEAMMPHRRKRKKKGQEGQEGEDKKEEENQGGDSPEYKESSKDLAKDSKDNDAPKPKPKPKPAPPPMSFTELLKIAEKKQFEPIIIEKKVEEDEKLLTKRQRKEADKEREWRERREARRMNEEKSGRERENDREREKEKSAKSGNVPISNKTSSKHPISSNNNASESRILERQLTKPNSSNSGDRSAILERQLTKPNSSNSGDRPGDRERDRERIPLKQTKPSLSGSSSQRPSSDSFKKPYPIDSKPVKPNVARSEELRPSKPKDSPLSTSNRPSSSMTNSSIKTKDSPLSTSNRPSSSMSNNSIKNPSKNPTSSSRIPDQKSSVPIKNSSSVGKPAPPVGSSRDVIAKKGDIGLKKGMPSMASNKPVSSKPKEFPPRDLLPPKGKPKEFPPRDLKAKQFQPPDDFRGVKRKQPMVVNRGRILDDDSEEEYDSELDDFIDDGPDEDNSYSSYIKEIFGYDKSRYRGLDDDVDDMETSFAQQMKEEVISTKIGIMEDLEDIKREEEEKKRKALRMKKMKR